MKKFITVCLLFIGLTAFAQENQTIVDQTLIDQGKEFIADNFDIEGALSQVNTVKELFVHYTKEVAEGSKSLITNGIQLVEKAVDLLYEQSTIVVRQFIIYTSISFAIPIIFGAFLIFWLPRIITKRLSMDNDKATAHNDSIDEDNDSIYKKDKKLSYLGVYYKNKFTLISSSVATYSGYIIGAYLVAINVMPFIKVTFFSKLYLVEMLLKYI